MTEQDYKEKSAAIKESGMPLDIQKYFQRLLDKDFNAEDKWILCSEKLPEKDGRYLTTSCLNEIETYDLWFEAGSWLTDECGEQYYGDVIAWQQLPEPYSCTSATNKEEFHE